MTRLRVIAAALAAAACVAAAPAHAQTASAPATSSPAPSLPSAPRQTRTTITPTSSVTFPQSDNEWRSVLRIGQDYTVRATDFVHAVVAVSGTVTIEGHVHEDVIVTLGDVRLASTSLIEGSVIVVGGNVTAAQGAEVRQDLIVVGGSIEAPPGFSSRGEHLIIGTPPLGEWLRGVVPWLAKGLLWGRLIVPDLGWIWSVVLVFFLMSFAINLVFDRPVRACAEVVTERPLGALIVGLVVLLLLAPIFLILAATVIGIAVIPFFACAVAAAWMIGKVGIARSIGAGLVHQSDRENRMQGARSFVLGFALIVLAYMVPVLGLITWAMVGVLGLGAATITFLAALRRESPKKSKIPPPTASPTADPAPPPPPAPTYDPAPAMSASDLSGSSLGADPYAPDIRQAAMPDNAPPPAPAPAAAVRPAIAFATFLDRVAAFVLDCLLVAVADQFFHMRFEFFLLLAYHVAFWAWMGTTMGGIIVGIKVIRTTGGEVRVPDAIVRGLASLFSLAALGIGCLWMLQDEDRQMWHDKVAGTFVIKAPRNLLLA